MALIKIFSVDFYISPPIQDLDARYSDFRGAAINHVPIIRIFGSSDNGSKTCLHMHGVFPYIYIPFDGSEHSSSIMYKVASKLDQTINLALGQASSNTQHVYKIMLVSGIPFYGYHSQQHQFLKIYFYNPLIMKKACSLLQNGNVLDRIYQLHEAHIPFILQFMIDYNLHGMNYISLSHVRHRKNPNASQSDVPFELFLPSNISKISTCELEIDGLAEHIVNRLEVVTGQIAKNPGIAALWEDERQRRRNKNESSQISPCMSQTRQNMPPTESHDRFKNVLNEKFKTLPTNSEYRPDPNASVYPVETPKFKDILSASFVESHSPTISHNTPKTNESNSSSLDLTDESISIFNKTLNNSILNDSDVKDMLNVLNDLGDNVNEEEGSVLSQVINDQQESDDENEMDMTLPLAAVTTPSKIIPEENSDRCVSENTSAVLNIPQLDGTSDVDELISKKRKVRKKNSVKGAETSASNSDKLKREMVNKSHCDILEKDSIENGINKVASKRKSDRVKRQLNFEEMNSSKTFIEEQIECRYTRSSSRKTLLKDINNGASKNSSQSETYHNLINDNCVVPKQNSQDLFSNEDDFSLEYKTLENNSHETLNNRIENVTNCLSKAEEYDISKNYVSIAGPSNLNIRSDVRNIPEMISQSSSSGYSQLHESCPQPSSKSNSQPESDLGQSISCSVAELTQNLTIFEQSPEESENSSLSNILVPKFNPPSRQMVESSMQQYKIPLMRHQEPFCSDFADVTGEVEIGHRVLKISTHTSNLPEFECRSVSQGLQKLRRMRIESMYPDMELTNTRLKHIKYSFCKNSDCILTPAKLPPSREDVESWLQQQTHKIKTVAVQKREKLKIFIPCSPGEENNSDNDDSITISPFSPTDEKLHDVTDNEETPKCSLRTSQTAHETPRTSKRNRKRSLNSEFTDIVNEKRSKNGSVLRKTLLQSQFLNNLLSPIEHLNDSGRISGATLNNTHGFRMSLENLQKAKAITEHENLTVLVIELHIQTRVDFRPNPEFDPIRAIFYSVFVDAPQGLTASGVIAVDVLPSNLNKTVPILEGTGVNCDIIYVDSEINLFHEFIKFVKNHNPDICAGYEVEQLSWGYLIERGYVLSINLQSSLSRSQVKLNFADDDSNIATKLTGRIILDVWRLMRYEVALQSYTFESIMYHVLHQRIPLYSFKDLSFWWEHTTSIYRHRTVDFYLCKVRGVLKLLEQLDLIGRTCELARLFGIQFYEVLSRGSQFRVESMMLRLAKPLNYIAVSPSVQQKAKMRAPEYAPLILEPESKFYADPVIVLDFQSLYPSMIIAYNYCFSTCLGRVEHLGKDGPFEFGATQLKVPIAKLKKLAKKNLLTFSPCGVAFVKPQVREGILPRMLAEILDTRLMVKKSMKQNKNDKVLQRILHSRQLGLKLIANVTYGYTAANFSGRMPAVELGDSVVSKGRETLLRAIKLIENTPEWGAKVVYGDTDSIFVLVPGQSRETAFKVGEAIADAVTNDNPSPVKLKLEKVYQPCILQTKKRYVGYKYESPEQTEPEFCAKGIETVRRDGCPAVSKMLEKCLKILFDTRDVSLVRKYVVRQFTKILNGRTSLQDLTFAKEYRGASNYRPGACVPVLELTRKWLAVDKRSEPRRKERVPYVIINGPPGLPLIKLVRCPREILSNSSLFPNALYYITRVIIPPLNRCFNLIGTDLNVWFKNMPRKQMQVTSITPDSSNRKRAIFHYFSTTSCIACGQQTPQQQQQQQQQNLCSGCFYDSQKTAVILQTKIQNWERSCNEVNLICQSCCGHPTSKPCISLDCPVLYAAIKTNQYIQQIPSIQQVLSTVIDSQF